MASASASKDDSSRSESTDRRHGCGVVVDVNRDSDGLCEGRGPSAAIGAVLHLARRVGIIL